MRFAHIVSVGLAIFAMLFGAGNVAFPLDLGRNTGASVLFAIAGLVATGVLVPLLGLISASLFDGNYKKFLGMTGRIPGLFLALVCMLLLGPFGATPRCITLAYAAVKWHIPQLSLFVFSIIVSCLVYAATIKKRAVVGILGRFLGPIKITLLLTIVVIGLLSIATPPKSKLTDIACFIKGLREGLWTLDLIGTIFFSGLIISSIKSYYQKRGGASAQQIISSGLKAGIIGGSLLGFVYTGFCVLAAKYGAFVTDIPKEQLLSALATLVLGSHASILANAAMAVACLTTAIALTTVFADYLTHELFLGRIKYSYALLITTVLTFVMTNLGFAGIAKVIEPIAILCYPPLIALSLANVAYALWGFKYTKFVFFSTLAATALFNFFHF